MPTVVILENDMWRMLKDKCRPKRLSLSKPLKCKVTLDVDKDAYKALDDDPLLLAKITEAASSEYYDAVNALTVELRKTDAAMQKTSDAAETRRLKRDFQSSAKQTLLKFSKNAKAKSEKAWADVTKTKSEYRTYQIKAGVDIGVDALATVAGIASATASAGVGLIIGIYSISKTIVGMAKKCYKLWLDAEKYRKRLNKNLEKLQKNFNKKKRQISGAKDTGKALANTLLGGDWFPTVSTVKADAGQYKSKLQGVDVSAHSLAQDLNKVLKKVDEAKKQPDIKNNKKLKALVEKMEGQTAKLIEKVIGMQEQVAEGLRAQKEILEIVTSLEKAEPKGWKYLQKGLPLIDVALAGGDFSKAGDALLTTSTQAVAEADKILVDKV
ncbi:MAG: hypothetical protein WCD16_06960 [Paracoccaceae bacterium]